MVNIIKFATFMTAGIISLPYIAAVVNAQPVVGGLAVCLVAGLLLVAQARHGR
jgi:hypothetical protein